MSSVAGRILIIVLSSLTVMAGVVFFSAGGLESLGIVLEQEHNGGNAPDGGLLPDAGTDVDTPPVEEKSMNILFCGIDNTSQLADVILLAKFDIENHSVKLLQIPRDTFIGTEYTTGKLNAACLPFSSKDPTARIAKIIETQFRLRVDHYVAVTLEGVREIVDAMGGIEADVPAQIDYLPGKTLYPGRQLLNGEKAEWFIRYREGYQTGDIGRLEAQRVFLKAALQSVKKMGKLKALSVAAKCYHDISTDIPLSLGASLVKEGMKVEEKDIEIHLLPCYGTSYGPYSVVVVNRMLFADLINEVFRPSEPVDPWELQIMVPPEPLIEPEEQERHSDLDSPFDFTWDESWDDERADADGIVIQNEE